jgi:hypothetical protein
LKLSLTCAPLLIKEKTIPTMRTDLGSVSDARKGRIRIILEHEVRTDELKEIASAIRAGKNTRVYAKRNGSGCSLGEAGLVTTSSQKQNIRVF